MLKNDKYQQKINIFRSSRLFSNEFMLDNKIEIGNIIIL